MDTELLQQHVRDALLDEASPPVCAWLFGSLARGEGHRRSDIDIAVLFGRTMPATLVGIGLDLEGRLEDRLAREVDIVVLDRAPVDLAHRVLRDGVLLFDCQPSTRVAFEVRSRREYFDLVPYLREYRGLEPYPSP